MNVYLDLVFLWNAAADFLLLCTVGRMQRLRMRLLFLLFSSALGGIFACAALFLPRAAAVSAAIVFAPLLLLAAYGKSVVQSAGVFGKACVFLFGSSFLAGGLYTLLSEYLPRRLSPVVFFLLCAGSFFFAFRYFDLFSLSETLIPVELCFETESGQKALRLLCDSGCLLREPISALPVILLSPKKFDALFPEAKSESSSLAARYRLRYVPLRTVSGEGVVPAVRPKHLTYKKGNKTLPLDAFLGRAQNEGFAGYDGVFPASLY